MHCVGASRGANEQVPAVVEEQVVQLTSKRHASLGARCPQTLSQSTMSMEEPEWWKQRLDWPFGLSIRERVRQRGGLASIHT